MNLSSLTRPTTLIVLIVVLVLLFGAKRLPQAARALGRSLRIMTPETRGLVDDGRSGDLDEKADAQSGREPLPRQSGTRPRDRDSGDRDSRDRDSRDRADGYDRDAYDRDEDDPRRSDRRHSDDAVTGEVVDPPQRARER
jgi:TatA/E family protein of Tat protein translocase